MTLRGLLPFLVAVTGRGDVQQGESDSGEELAILVDAVVAPEHRHAEEVVFRVTVFGVGTERA